MTDEQFFNERESLRMINRMIYEAKGYFYETGLSALVYGFSIFICSMLAYARDKNFISFPFSPFWMLVPIFFVQGYIQFREDKKKKAKTFTDEAIDYVWTGFFLAVFASFAGYFAGLSYGIFTIILFLTGFAAFLTGAIAKFKYDIYAGIVCWLFAIISFFMLNANIYLLLAITAIIVWVIPGFILHTTFKKLHHNKESHS